MKLAQLYSLATGLKIGPQYMREDFFPLGLDRYIVIQAGSGMQSKNYPYFQMVVDLLNPALDKEGIKIVQLGGKDDQKLSGCTCLNGQASPNQSAYLLRHALLLVGNDSWLSHRAGELKMPLVTCFGPTSVENHSAYHYDADKTTFLESHRWNRRPTFSNVENPSSTSLIPPEQITNAVLKLLNLPVISRQTIYIGPLFQQFIVEVVPNTILPPNLYPDAPVTLRFDYHFNENILGAMKRKMHIVSDKPIDANKIRDLRKEILGINYEVTAATDLEYLKKLRYSGVKTMFFTRESDDKKLADLRLKFFDIGIIEKMQDTTREEFFKSVSAYLNKELDKNVNLATMKYRSNKYLFSYGKVYLSKADWKADKAVDLNNPISTALDTEDFFREMNHFYVYKE